MYILDVLFILSVVMVGYVYNVTYEEQSRERNLCGRHVLLLFSLWTGGNRAMQLQKRGRISTYSCLCEYG